MKNVATSSRLDTNRFLDDLLDGKPMLIVDSPELRRMLRKRRIERAREERAELDALGGWR